MRSLFRSLPLCLVLLGLTPEAGAQALGDRSVTRPVAGDPGLFSGQVLNEPQYRVLRDYAEPGATRRMHNHPEATFHVLVLLSGRLRITIEGEAPREVNPGEVLALKGGVMHTFTNLSDQTATLVEVFGKAPVPGDEAAMGAALAQALMAAGRSPASPRD